MSGQNVSLGGLGGGGTSGGTSGGSSGAGDGSEGAREMSASSGAGIGAGADTGSSTGSSTTTNTNTNTDTVAGTAPTYVNAAQQGRDPGKLKPKGTNLQEGGFEGNEPNASLGQASTDNIGSENDPGRVAEQKLQNRAAEAAGSAAGSRDMKASGAAQGSGSSGGYDALGEQKLG